MLLQIINLFAFDMLNAPNKQLTEVHLPSTLTKISDYCFRQCTTLKILVCNAVTPPTMSGNGIFQVSVGSFIIYVPDVSVEDYKVATSWVKYANYIKPLSELPE